MGAVILFPAFYLLVSHNVFYLQIIVVSIFLVLYILRHKKHSLNLLDQAVLIYVVWVFGSFALNAFFEFNFNQNLHRFTSFFIFLGYMTPYVIARNYFRNPYYLKYILWGVVGVYTLFFVYVIFQFLSFGVKDLMAARVILGQRIPMIITFIVTLAIYYIFTSDKKTKAYLYLFCLTGIVLIFLSLTRACYFQFFIGIFFIFFIIFKTRKKSLIKKLIFVVTIFIIGFFLLSSLGVLNIESITTRLGNVLTLDSIRQDASFIDRVAIWGGLFGELSQDPTRIIFGYGQLGPSYVGAPIWSVVLKEKIELYSAHNEYLDVLIRNGVVGLILYLVIWALVICGGFFPKREMPHDARTLFVGHSIALLGVLGYGLFHETVRFPIFGMYFWFYLGIVSAVLYSKKESLLEKNNYKKDESYKVK